MKRNENNDTNALLSNIYNFYKNKQTQEPEKQERKY